MTVFLDDVTVPGCPGAKMHGVSSSSSYTPCVHRHMDIVV